MINPFRVLENHKMEEIYDLKEPVLAHYTPLGHQLIGNIYKNEILKSKEKKVCQIYYTSPERMRKYTFHGLGDYLRGTIFLHQKLGDGLTVSFSHHPLNDYLYSPSCKSIKECEEAKYVFEGEIDWKAFENVFTNKFHSFPVSDETISFIKKNCLSPRIAFSKRLQQVKQELQLDDYQVIHIRSGDQSFGETSLNSSIFSSCDKIISTIHNDKMLIMSDSSFLQESLASRYNLKFLPGKKIPPRTTLHRYRIYID